MDGPIVEDTNGDNDNFAPEYRDRLRTWLEKMINSGNIPGLCWENKEHTIFRMPWKHAGRQDYNLEEDSKIFMAWAVHSGRYREGIDKPEPIVWKTRLRCALNKMPDIRELPERSRLDISEPYRVYQLLPPVHKASQIRRRLYKRSQSHENEHIKSYGEHSRAVSLVNIPEHDQEWKKQAAIQRRNSSIETTSLNLSKARTSPLASNTAPASTPGFWFPTQSALSLKYPLLNGLASGGVHIPQPISMDPNHTRYPLMPSFANPFANYSSSSITPFLSNPAALDALKRSSLVNPSFISPQKYQEHLSNITKHLKGETLLCSDETISCKKESVRETYFKPKSDATTDETSTKFLHLQNSSELALKNTNQLSKLLPSHLPSDLLSVQDQLDEYQHKIKALEKDLEQTRSAHEQERKAREKLQKEKDNMKMTLEQLENMFHHHSKQLSPEYTKALLLGHFENKTAPTPSDMARLLKNYQNGWRQGAAHSITVQTSATPIEQADAVLINGNSRSSKRKYSRENRHVKRPSSPLDLTVSNPMKKRKISHDDDDRSSTCSDKYSPPPPNYSDSSFVTSVRPRASSLAENKRSMMSPLSRISNSPVSVEIHSQKEKRAFNRASLSPIQRSPGLLSSFPQRQGTIQVT